MEQLSFYRFVINLIQNATTEELEALKEAALAQVEHGDLTSSEHCDVESLIDSVLESSKHEN